jgi:hypothetical protein
MLMGGTGTFKQVYAILAHSGAIFALSVLFAMPLSYATHRMAGANLGVFVPMLEETTFLARFLGAIDLFVVWWSINVAIGVGVLFKRKTAGIAAHRRAVVCAGALVLRHRSARAIQEGTQGLRDDNSDQDRHRGARRADRRRRGGGNIYWRDRGVQVATEPSARGISGSARVGLGQDSAQRQVNISANTMGKVTRGRGRGPRSRDDSCRNRSAVAGGPARTRRASVPPRSRDSRGAHRGQSANIGLTISRSRTSSASEELWKDGLTTKGGAGASSKRAGRARDRPAPTRAGIKTRGQRIKQEAGLATTKYNLNQVIISSPMDGLVTRRNIEEGETAVVGTMNNAGTVLLTIADMSVLEAEIEVDETDIPNVSLGQVAKVKIDAVPDREFGTRGGSPA